MAKLGQKWVEHLLAGLWADRVTTRRSIDFASYKVVFGQDCVLLVELHATTWAIVDWRRVKTKEQLLAAQARQLERREENLTTAAKCLKANQMANKKFFDSNRRKQKQGLEIGTMVLLYNSRLDKQWSKKLDNRGMGPYTITDIAENRGTYMLAELDGTALRGVYPGEWLKVILLAERN